MSIHIVLASGGTGGHFYPTLAISRALRARGASVSLVVAGHHADEHLRLAAANEIPAWAVQAPRLPSGPLGALAFPCRFLRSLRGARRRVRELAPDALLGMGSFASVPACLGAVREGIPLLLHEGNAWMGRANRFLSRRARAAGVSLPLDPGCRVHCRLVHTGMPLREALVAAAGEASPPTAFLRASGLDAGRTTLLVFGGSQGAGFLNELVPRAINLLGDLRSTLQVIHLTGTEHNTPYEEAYRAAAVPCLVRRADPDIHHAYRAADMVVCRAGASSICELALFGRPAILIPLPSAAEDHQTVNARTLAEAGAAVHLPQSQASPEALAARLRDWIEDPSRRHGPAANIRTFARSDAAAAMADLCLETAMDSPGRRTRDPSAQDLPETSGPKSRGSGPPGRHP
ncbi:MAG: UDP-N-acetylglucosamine--N-acetylmuramyl-(pentapeptide) pyrophosphoryl-undecaprenol N-acetylglucosamine transferase [Lentisphaeria bacterium]|nr:UDP-N-acetylglucosamine--N-acetylmuramyl-(pentapeptide) pyrophosphoryl-undecaprenol N-acetylglucosamine transferase [Lentisphaeria bacterium]